MNTLIATCALLLIQAGGAETYGRALGFQVKGPDNANVLTLRNAEGLRTLAVPDDCPLTWAGEPVKLADALRKHRAMVMGYVSAVVRERGGRVVGVDFTEPLKKP